MIIQTKLSEKEFLNASLVTFWSRGYFKVLSIALPLFVAFNIYTSWAEGGSVLAAVLPVVLIFGLMFFITRFSIKKAYRQNHRAAENITYNFTDTHLLVTGESFTSDMTWDKIYKITKTKKWLFIWHSGQIANAIPLGLVPPAGIMQLQEILEKNKTKNNL